MKLLFDHNLSIKLVNRLSDFFPDAVHLAQVGLDAATDHVVWQYAKTHNYCLVTKDSDFNDLLGGRGFPPKVIWVRVGNCTTSDIVALLQKHHEAIVEFLENDSVGLLELQ
ncbi:MAG: DUF5615 family PIN-like protein [bacterium]|nr:DUF5615 family PIN-like protein [bacterium]